MGEILQCVLSFEQKSVWKDVMKNSGLSVSSEICLKDEEFNLLKI
jgi:hypothetical protein